VLFHACRQVRSWRERGASTLRLSVNLSPRQFQQRGLTEMVRRVLEETRLPAEALDLEITEGIAMQNVPLTERLLSELTGMGVGIAVDDFGTGHSSLAYLKRFPIHCLKVDQSFIAGMAEDGRDRAIVQAIISLAHSLGLRVTAEGVERPEQADLLTRVGCDEVQGFLFGRPLPEDGLETLLFPAGAATA